MSIERSRKSSLDQPSVIIEQSNGEREEERTAEGKAKLNENEPNTQKLKTSSITEPLDAMPPHVSPTVVSPTVVSPAVVSPAVVSPTVVSPAVVSPAVQDSGTPPALPSITVVAPPIANQSGANTPLMTTPSKAFVASIGSPLYGGDGRESESEVNSIAVEPPSPNRDEISFAVDEQSFRADETASFSGPATPTSSHTTEEVGVVLSETKAFCKDESMEEETQEKETIIEKEIEKGGGGDEIKEDEKEKEISPEEENNGGEVLHGGEGTKTDKKEDTIITEDMEDTVDTGEVITTGDLEDTINTGDIEGAINTGDTITTGDIEGAITTRDIEGAITTGDTITTGDIEGAITTGDTITTGDLEESNEGGSVSDKEGEKEEGGGGVGMVSLVGENNHEATEQVDLVVSTNLNDEELSDFPSIQKEPQDAGISVSPAGKREGSVGVASNNSSDMSSRKRQGSVTDDTETDKKPINDVSIKIINFIIICATLRVPKGGEYQPHQKVILSILSLVAIILNLLGLQERRRRWGSSTSQTPTATQPPISSEMLEVLKLIKMMNYKECELAQESLLECDSVIFNYLTLLIYIIDNNSRGSKRRSNSRSNFNRINDHRR